MAATRTYALDGLRGVAALLVACYHAGVVIKPELIPGGYLAVDFFFILSGFVIDRAYSWRLQRGMTARQFMILRLYRLYPLVLLGMLLGLALLLVKRLTHQLDMTAGEVGVATVFNLLMLPIPFAYKHNFPLDSPAWSLSCEMVLNLVFAVALFRAPRRLLWLVALGGAAVMAFGAVTGTASLNLGWRGDTFVFGLARATFGFTFGMILARWLELRPVRDSVPMVIPVALLIAALATPISFHLRPAFDLAFAFVVAPLIVVLGAQTREVPRLNQTCFWLGLISYPVYTLHFPMLQFVHGAIGSRLSPAAAGFALVAASVALAVLAERLVDSPARRRGAIYLRGISVQPPAEALGVATIGG